MYSLRSNIHTFRFIYICQQPTYVFSPTGRIANRCFPAPEIGRIHADADEMPRYPFQLRFLTSPGGRANEIRKQLITAAAKAKPHAVNKATFELLSGTR